MADSNNKVTGKKSIFSKFTGIFKKKKRDNSSSRSPSQCQTKSYASSNDEQSDQGTSKSSENGIYRQVLITSDSTSSPQSSTPSSIDPAHVLVTVAAGAGDESTPNPTNENQISNVAYADNNGEKIAEATNSNSQNEKQDKLRAEKELVETVNKDGRITRLRTNDSNDKIVINQHDNNVQINLNNEKAQTGTVETGIVGGLNEGKISSEIMKRQWFNDEKLENIRKASNIVIQTEEIVESVEESSYVKTEFIRMKSDEAAAYTNTIIVAKKQVEVEEHKEAFHKDDSKILIEVERNERCPETDYFTTGKFASYFLLEIEKQYYDPTEVYSMVRYRESEDSDDSDSEGENSSSESTSPNIPATMRRRLLHRRSADNLMVNSPTSSMRHSSPESVKSAPIQLKPRSTSHDALSKRKDKQANQADGISTNSLAKQSLLAARVLIPAQKARERNFLHGRIAANSLLGPVELEKVLPNREIKIFIGTWNMNGQPPPKELNDFMLPSGIETIPDMLAIGTQESYSERSEWEAALQETLGPSHVLLTSTGLGTLHLALFVRRDLIWFCSVPEDDNCSTRTGTAFRTKGAVALAIMLFGTSFLFVTAHLTAHQDKVKERVNDIKSIVRNLDLPKDLPTKNKNRDVTQNFDCVFWCGDLNFRLAQPREEVIQWITNTQFPQDSPINLHKDQLRTILNEGAVLQGFEEGAIMFPPTYKYDPGSQNFDSSSKQRTPAYTDRILFKGKNYTRGHIRSVSYEGSNTPQKDGSLECLVYDSVPSICTSDHKPVWGVFKTTIRPGIDTIPLAAGLFNREVYLEGIKRRAAAMDDIHGMSRKNSRRAIP